ncbi:conserved membrane hypothetical protein [Paraburkholderia tropica]|uniref:hypothetical protein n=1 Tax=Paraburkholderia tropica TaxID=92647 RepID=UPI001CAC5786|nr:hypothetical protein [Paraburkholderia tropica]CAG9209315.1 conserved membrane hypothetical protein [Paraburkholderia tropica]
MPSIYPAYPPTERTFSFQAALLAGLLSIVVNTTLLIVADHFHIVTARGGLLTLLLDLIGAPLPSWLASWVTSWPFRQLFHVAVGVAMIVIYAATLARLYAPVIAKGLFSAALVWLVNAAVILPAIGQGFAGAKMLSPLGMTLFGAAHTLFFLMGAVLYERWR